MLGNRLKRYKGLVILISALILFIIAVVVLRTYIDTVVVQRESYARVTTLSYVEMLERFSAEDEKLREDVRAHLVMFRDGGRLATPFGPAWEYPPVQTQSMIQDINSALEAYERSDWPAFETRFAEFDRGYGTLIQGRQKALLIAQYAAAAIMFFGFLGVLSLLFFRLGKADDEAAEVRRENDHILASTKEGVFLIDSNYQIGEQRSKAVSSLFGQNIEVSGNFIELIKKFVAEEDLQRTSKFLGLVFGGRVKPKLMGDLNPLHNVEFNIDRKVGGSVRRVLNFDFSRDEQNDEVSDLLVTVSDITNEVILREELETIQKVQDERLTMLKGVLHVEPTQLSEFFEKGRAAYTQINESLEEDNLDPGANAEKLEQIARITHRLKGDAGALRLDLFSTSLHRFEDTIDSLRKQKMFDGQSMVKLVVQLKDMIAELDLARSLTKQFGMQALAEENAAQASGNGPAVVSPVEQKPQAESFVQKLSDLASAVAEREAKRVNVSVVGEHYLEGWKESADAIYEIAVQLVRNAVVHGIEAPAERVEHNKPETGRLDVSLAKTADELLLTVKDDGQGLQFDKIRSKAIEAGHLDGEAAKASTNQSLLRYIFAHGITSSDTVTEDAGRGVGLDAVRELVKQQNGRISVGTAAGEYSQFVVKIPASQAG